MDDREKVYRLKLTEEQFWVLHDVLENVMPDLMDDGKGDPVDADSLAAVVQEILKEMGDIKACEQIDEAMLRNAY